MEKYKLKHRVKLPQILEPVAQEARWFKILARECVGLFIEKNNGYKNRFLDDGLAGIILRIQDKLQRLSIQLSGLVKDDDEDPVESMLDIAVYALMGALILHFGPSPKRSCSHLYREEKSALVCVFCGKTRKR